MDILSFIAALVAALAWPAAVIVSVLVLRRPLLTLLPKLEELQYKDFVLRFRKELSEAEARLPVEKQEQTALPPPTVPERERLEFLAAVSPRSAVLEAWVVLEGAILKKLVELGQVTGPERFRGHGRLAVALQSMGVFSQAEVGVFNQLRDLRNQAAHAPEFALTPSDAIGYVQLSVKLIEHVRSGK